MLLKILILILKKIYLVMKITTLDLRVCLQQETMELQQLIKVYLQAVKKMTNVHHGLFKLIRLLTMKIKNKYFMIMLW